MFADDNSWLKGTLCLHLPGIGMNMELQSNCEVGSMETFVYGLRSNQKRVRSC